MRRERTVVMPAPAVTGKLSRWRREPTYASSIPRVGAFSSVNRSHSGKSSNDPASWRFGRRGAGVWRPADLRSSQLCDGACSLATWTQSRGGRRARIDARPRRDADEFWRKLGPVAARRAKLFGDTSLFRFDRLLPAWDDVPRFARNSGFA